MKKFAGKIVQFFTKNRQITMFIICLVASFFLWLFITYGREYQNNVSYPISFKDSSNSVKYITQDSVITLNIKANGFEFMFKNFQKNKKRIVLNTESLNINLSKGKATVQSSRFKEQISDILGLRGVEFSISPSNINLSWHEIYTKKVPIRNCCTFKFTKPYNEYIFPQMLMNYAVLEAGKEDLNLIDSINTKPITYNNIQGNCIFFVPLDIDSLPKGVSCKLSNVPIRICSEKYTENTISLPIRAIRNDNYKNIKLIPTSVKVRYLVALKDYSKVNKEDMNAYVVCSDNILREGKKLKIQLNNIPDYVKIVNIYPEKADYILFK